MDDPGYRAVVAGMSCFPWFCVFTR